MRTRNWITFLFVLFCFITGTGVSQEELIDDTDCVRIPMLPSEEDMAKGFDSMLTPVWTNGVLQGNIKSKNIAVEDLNNDGINELVLCAKDGIVVLKCVGTDETGDNMYESVWFSEKREFCRFAIGDRDQDGIKEIYGGTSESEVYVFDCETYEEVGFFEIAHYQPVKDMAVADVDRDNEIEIVVVQQDTSYIYSAQTLDLEWQAYNKGGTEVCIGDIDGDTEVEIVVNDDPAHILCGYSHCEKWAYAGGFGYEIGIGDVDGDGIDEIAYSDSYDEVVLFEADTHTEKWRTSDLGDPVRVMVHDMENDGICEVIVGNDWSGGAVIGLEGTTGNEIWRIPSSNYEVSALGIGDPDNDNVTELLWGEHYIAVGDWITQTEDYIIMEQGDPLSVAAGDLDLDGQTEIVMISFDSDEGSKPGEMSVYNGVTHAMIWSYTYAPPGYNYDLSHVAIGQVDSDAALEVIIVAENYSNVHLIVLDGITHELEWESQSISNHSPTSMEVLNLDNDPVDEIVLGISSDDRIYIFDGASPVIQWDSGKLEGYLRDYDFGNLDLDAELEMAVITSSMVYVYEVGSWQIELNKPVNYGENISIANSDMAGAGELLIITDYYDPKIESWDGISYNKVWSKTLDSINITDLYSADVDYDGVEEFVISGYHNYTKSYLDIYYQKSASCCLEYRNEGWWGPIYGVVSEDVDNDEQNEIVFCTDNLIQVNKVDQAPIPDIKANGSDGLLSIPAGDSVVITVSLSPGVLKGQDADWWVEAKTPFDPFWYTLTSNWVPSLTPIRLWGGPLFSFNNFAILDTTILPVGTYEFTFSVDENMDEVLDATFSDTVRVEVY